MAPGPGMHDTATS